MKYRPYWQRIIFLAVIFNLILILFSSSVWSLPYSEKNLSEDLQELEWIDTDLLEVVSAEPGVELPSATVFQEIVLPPLEIQHTEFAPLPELNKELPPPPSIENKPPEIENKPPEVENKLPEEKKETDPADKLKVIVKVYPKDLMEQFIITGAVKGKITLKDKIILAVTITTEGKVRNVEIRQGAGNDEQGKLINLVSSMAVQSWIFEPYLDEDGNPQELKTQIEFTAEDF